MEKPTEKGLDYMLALINEYLMFNRSMIPEIFETICILHDIQEKVDLCSESK
jgi:hypothetical protein